MDAMYEIKIKKFSFPVDGYGYAVETWRSVDGGDTFAFCGEQELFKFKYEADDRKKELEAKYHIVKYMFRCMNAAIDGRKFTGFKDDEEAIAYGSNYEADVYRVEPGKGETLIYKPAF